MALVLAAIVVLVLLQQAGGVGPWWLELSRYLPYPVVLVPAGAALLLSCWLGRRWVVASIGALVLAATALMGLAWSGADRGDVRVRLMTYNIKAYLAAQRSDGFARLAREVALHDPDILVMQDAHGPRLGSARSAFPAGPVFGYPQVFVVGQYVVASRFPLRDCGQSDIGDRGRELSYVHCRVNAKGNVLKLVTAHFESPRDGLNAARHEGFDGIGDWQANYDERLAQARALARDLKGSPGPLVVAGDLNAPESSPVIRALLGIGLRDAFSSAGRGYGYTYGHALRLGFSFLRIDHILVSPDIGVAGCFAGNAEASEHRPVIADLLLRHP